MRKSFFSGTFYSSDKDELLKQFSAFNSYKNSTEKQNVRAIISPHAGFIYSGEGANMLYSLCSTKNVARVIVIGPSHKYSFKGSTICLDDSYETPFANIEIDKKYSKKLYDEFQLEYLATAHSEHSTEVQMPFIKHYLPQSKVVEIIYSDQEVNSLSKLITYLLKDSANLVVISSDLSHFQSETVANKKDHNCLNAIENLETDFLKECEACGKIGMSALLLSAKELNLTSKIIDYRTSAKVSNNKNSVVGYGSAIFY
ncbi:MAG: AmmeMemoRadiSam system protein B [Helicobacteraceae bacterium]|nr:AmmeMemoRadiSam system protein B [Helicobacteraceae bacterium]